MDLETYKENLKIWDNLLNVKKDIKNLEERDDCPMHPYIFFRASTVSGFNKENGNTYKEYLELWQKFYNKKIN